MPTARTYTKNKTVQKSKFSNFGYSKFSTKTINTEYFAKKAESNVFAFRDSAVKSAAKIGGAVRSSASKIASKPSGLAKSGNLSKSNASQKRPTMRGALPSDRWYFDSKNNDQPKFEYNSSLRPNSSNDETMPKTYTWWNNSSSKNSAVAARQQDSYSSKSYAINRSATNYFTGGRKVVRSYFGTAPSTKVSAPSIAVASQSSRNFGARAASKSNYEFAGQPSMNPSFDGTAAKKLEPQIKQKKVKEKKVAKPIVTAIPGQRTSTGIFHSTKLSPTLLTFAKAAGCAILLVAALSFVRVGFNSATVKAGISANTINSQIEEQINLKNSLQVQDSALSNSSRIRNAANQYQLVSPETTTAITLGPDVLSVDNNQKIKLVDSINRLASINS